MRIKVNTYFDITETGINRIYRGQRLPAKIRNTTIKTVEQWNLMRNQQNNLETVHQVLSMRATPENITKVSSSDGIWSFAFEVLSPDVYGSNLILLKEELVGVPMTIGLLEKEELDPFLTGENIWFEVDV